MAEYSPNVNRINKRNIGDVSTGILDVERINKRRKERVPTEISRPLISEEKEKEIRAIFPKETRLPEEKPTKEPELIWTSPVKKPAEFKLTEEIKRAGTEIFKDIGYHLKPYLPWKWTEPEGVVGKTIDFTERAIDSVGRLVADPSEYDEEGNLTLFPKIRGALLLGVLLVEGVALAGGMKEGLAYRKSMQTFEKWRKALGERRLKTEFDRYLKSQKLKDVQRNMRTFFERITKWFRRKPRPTGERFGKEVRFRGRLPEIGKKELFATKEENAIKNIEQVIKRSGEINRNLRKAGFKIERPAHYLKAEQKPFITDNIIAIKDIPTAEGGKGVALANIDLGSVKLFKSPIEIKQELIRLSLDTLLKATPKEEALADIKSIMPRIRELSTHITASKSIGREVEPETYTELERLNDRVSELMPAAYPETAERGRPIPEVPKEFEPLAEEARKYSSIEEWKKHIRVSDIAKITMSRDFIDIEDFYNQVKGIRPKPEVPANVKRLLEIAEESKTWGAVGEPLSLTQERERLMGTLTLEEQNLYSDLLYPEEKVRPGVNPFAFQDSNQEKVTGTPWDKGSSYRFILEGSGDIFRETTKSRPDFKYISEKIRRIREYIKDVKTGKHLITGIHPEDSFDYSQKNNPEKFELLKKQWSAQPVENEIQNIAKNLNLAMLENNIDEANGLISNIESYFSKAKPEVSTRVPLEEITPEQAQSELIQRKAGLKFPDETEQEAKKRIVALNFYAKPTAEVAKIPPTVPEPEAIKVEKVKPGIPRGWKLIQDTQWMKRYKTEEGTLEVDIAQVVPKDGLRKFTFRTKKYALGEKIEIRAKSLEEAIKKYVVRIGAVEVYEQAGIRKLERYEINRVVEDLEMSAFKVPPDDTDIKRSIETVMGTLSKEEMSQAIKDVKLYTEKPTEENIQRMYDGGIEEDKRSYPEQYKRMRELLNRWNDLTGEEKEEFSRLGDTVIRRIADFTIASEKDMGFPIEEIEATRKESALQATFSSLAGILDLHAKFPKWARKSAIAVKRVWNTGEMMNKKGIWINRKINKAGRAFGAKRVDYIEMFVPASQRALLKEYAPEQQKMFKSVFEILDNWFKEELVTLKKKGILEKGFIERVKGEAIGNIQHYRAARSNAKTTKERLEFDELITQEREVLDFIKKMDVRYVHLPVRIILEQLMDKPAIRKHLKLGRFFRRRETIDVANWVKELEDKWYPDIVRNTRAIRKEIEKGTARLVKGDVGVDKELVVARPVLDKNMLDIRRIVAAYAHKLGRLYGLADIVNAFQSDGLIKDLPSSGIVPERYTTLPAKYFPEFQGKIAMRIAADWLQDYLDTIYKPRSNITRTADRIFGYFKLMQFTMPFFMPAYDVYQASIHWGLRWALMKPHKVPGVIKKAIKSFVKKDSYYWDFWKYCGSSKPFTAPWKTYMGDIELLTQDTGLQWLLQFVKSHHMTTFIDALYIPIWNANWGGDELVRLVSYHAMLEEGHIPEEAAQLAATVHSDYARMPAKTRRVLNKIFFVPVFPFTMAVWEYEMMKAAVLESMRLGAKGLGKVFPPMKKLEAKLTPTADEMFKRRKSMAKGLLGLLMMVALREGIQKALGFKRDVIGLRYTREIPDPDDPRRRKELVKYIPTPDNVLLRHIFRWSGLPSEPDKVHFVAGKAAGILHPLLSFPVELAMNRKRDFTPITELSQIWDGPSGWAKMGLEYTAYAGERFIRILQSIPGLATKHSEEEKKVIQEWRKITPEIARIMEYFCFLYIRNTKDVRGRREVRGWYRIMREEAREDERQKGRPLTEKEIRRRIDRYREMRDKLLNITGGRVSPTYKPNVGRINKR